MSVSLVSASSTPSVAVVLAAGLGTRIQELSKLKPMVSVQGVPLIDRCVQSLKSHEFDHVICAFNSQCKTIPFQELSGFGLPGVESFFVDTPSSFHTLWEAVRFLENSSIHIPSHVLVTLVDTVLAPRDFAAFIKFCETLSASESGILTTTHIDDEKPLFVRQDQDCIQQFTDQKEPQITSGMYCFSKEIFPLAAEANQLGIHKMRNFLNHLVTQKLHRMRAFSVKKTIDIDHPKDLKSAEDFLGEVLA